MAACTYESDHRHSSDVYDWWRPRRRRFDLAASIKRVRLAAIASRHAVAAAEVTMTSPRLREQYVYRQRCH
jgi:hypothetical protein